MGVVAAGWDHGRRRFALVMDPREILVIQGSVEQGSCSSLRGLIQEIGNRGMIEETEVSSRAAGLHQAVRPRSLVLPPVTVRALRLLSCLWSGFGTRPLQNGRNPVVFS